MSCLSQCQGQNGIKEADGWQPMPHTLKLKLNREHKAKPKRKLTPFRLTQPAKSLKNSPRGPGAAPSRGFAISTGSARKVMRGSHGLELISRFRSQVGHTRLLRGQLIPPNTALVRSGLSVVGIRGHQWEPTVADMPLPLEETSATSLHL